MKAKAKKQPAVEELADVEAKKRPVVEKPADGSGTIVAGAVYTLAEFQRRTNIGEWGMRQARRKGLPTIKVGRGKFVRANDFLAFLDSQAGERRVESKPRKGPEGPRSRVNRNLPQPQEKEGRAG